MLGSNTSNVLDGLLSVIKLGKDFLVGQSGHWLVRPGMACNVMTILNTTESTIRPVNDIGTDVEHGSLLLFLFQEIIKAL